ncbi:hypothetical protein A3C89_03905 [Candidatus Kaiserbacteria bacterium RIFCSPHIGHO2_02_FULL_50_50]|uniref:Antitoxin SocA-like Panacea domain-containing protein n=1 Tax=Candidatus Kaiserbacteria bacterium RIFCSPHIGHO2_02_FULL_50_50 TaxID=1798492 RepID=A0A1F6DFC0_9BACT|nr:MAG: hypothetical protein A3C89_03905 [Candidatus Kaiserbacteria bacterium RIFCSPHIGHO2_02_FULL_50_50]OGG88240.1 MAG: hypothetical protein A3G62_04050 [Candidatus Kaiserbacteria bacterium RIFCSPLOWO2_12_FULL_50_10]
MQSFEYKKAIQAINYFVRERGGSEKKLNLLKLLFLADRYHIRRYGRPIFNDVYFAMTYGPVASAVKDVIEFSDFLSEMEKEYARGFLAKGKEDNAVESIASVDEKVFSKSDLEALRFVVENFEDKNLVTETHRYPEWKRFEAGLITIRSREEMKYEDFFENPDDGLKDPFALSDELLLSSKEMFREAEAESVRWR